MALGIRSYSQWFKGVMNEVADALSCNNDRSDEELTNIINLFALHRFHLTSRFNNCPMKSPQGWLCCCSNYPWASSCARHTQEASLGVALLEWAHALNQNQRGHLPWELLTRTTALNHWSLHHGCQRRTFLKRRSWTTGCGYSWRYRAVCICNLQRKRVPKPNTWQGWSACVDSTARILVIHWPSRNIKQQSPASSSFKSTSETAQNSKEQPPNLSPLPSSLQLDLVRTYRYINRSSEEWKLSDSKSSDSFEEANQPWWPWIRIRKLCLNNFWKTEEG